MKIAIPVTDGMVEQHFGQREQFAIVDVADGDAGHGPIELVDARDVQHNHVGTVELLKLHGVHAIVAGGMGYPMFASLKNAGFEVITGAEGSTEEVVHAFAAGKLVDKGDVHEHHHEHDHHHEGGHHHGYDH